MAARKQDIFESRVVPIMNSVHQKLCSKRADELREYNSSARGVLSVGADPMGLGYGRDLDSLRTSGQWNSKTTEDYVNMVKAELKKKGIAVTKDVEKKMIDKMVRDKIPKSSIDYIIRKAGSNTLFSLPNEVHKTTLDRKIEEKAEKAYNPSTKEKVIGWALGTAADVASTGGFSMGWKTAAKIAGTETALGVADEAIPLVIAPDKRDEYLADQKKREKQAQTKSKAETKKEEPKEETQVDQSQTDNTTTEQQQPEKTNEDGWSQLISAVGLNGFNDILSHPGTTLAMLPDILVGMFTGTTKSLNIKDNLIPLASIVGGMFVRNPLLKAAMMGIGGANLLNKAGHEILSNSKERNEGNTETVSNVNSNNHYRQYVEEPLNPRIQDPQIRGNYLIMSIDRVPCTTLLPDNVIDAYNQGALPINTLANAILSKSERMQQVASENYETSQQQNVQRGMTLQ